MKTTIEKTDIAAGIEKILKQDKISAANYAHSINVPPTAVYGLLKDPSNKTLIPKRLQKALGIAHQDGTLYELTE